MTSTSPPTVSPRLLPPLAIVCLSVRVTEMTKIEIDINNFGHGVRGPRGPVNTRPTSGHGNWRRLREHVLLVTPRRISTPGYKCRPYGLLLPVPSQPHDRAILLQQHHHARSFLEFPAKEAPRGCSTVGAQLGASFAEMSAEMSEHGLAQALQSQRAAWRLAQDLPDDAPPLEGRCGCGAGSWCASQPPRRRVIVILHGQPVAVRYAILDEARHDNRDASLARPPHVHGLALHGLFTRHEQVDFSVHALRHAAAMTFDESAHLIPWHAVDG